MQQCSVFNRSLLPYIISIRACNRYQPQKQGGSYITVCAYVCFYGLYIPTVTNRQVLRLTYRIHTHIHYIIRILSPLSRIPVLPLISCLRICTTLSPWQAVLIYHISLCPSDTASIQQTYLPCIFL